MFNMDIYMREFILFWYLYPCSPDAVVHNL